MSRRGQQVFTLQENPTAQPQDKKRRKYDNDLSDVLRV
jgi:hypothetical protein